MTIAAMDRWIPRRIAAFRLRSGAAEHQTHNRDDQHQQRRRRQLLTRGQLIDRYELVLGRPVASIGEDPAKMIRMVILEMEETLVEVRASAARCIADGKEMRRVMDRFGLGRFGLAG